jgi:hypothetical protein
MIKEIVMADKNDDIRERNFYFSDKACRNIVHFLVTELEDDITNGWIGRLFESLLYQGPSESCRIVPTYVKGDIIARFEDYRDREMEGN